MNKKLMMIGVLLKVSKSKINKTIQNQNNNRKIKNLFNHNQILNKIQKNDKMLFQKRKSKFYKFFNS